MRAEVIRKAEAHLAGMAVLDLGEVTITQKASSIEVGYMESRIELPLSQSAADDAARFLVGAAVYAEAQRTGRDLYSGPIID
ncbi:MAG: hypothetical protein AB7E51_18090 [Pseudodesulfovibrio sp.]|nr:hypothetical protein [Pseudodesulfovibrio indicus]